MTVRQLEAIVRLSEAIAKMRLSKEASRNDVEEAHRLFKVSTMNAIKGGIALGSSASNPELVLKLEDAIKRRVNPGSRYSMDRLLEELEGRYSNMAAIHSAIHNLVRREEFDTIQEGKVLLRKK